MPSFDIGRVLTGLATMGGSEVARAVGGDVGKVAGAAVNPASAALIFSGNADTGGGGGSKPKPTPVPSGPATKPDIKNFSSYLGTGSSQAPQGINFGGTSTQQRSQIATGGTAGNAGVYNTPEVQRFYRDLAIRTMTDEGGNPTGSPLPVERQYLQQVFGQTPRNESTASFLSALLRNDYS